MHYITAPQPVAAGLVKYGDFLAPPQGAMRYGYGCLLYSHYCDFSTQGALAACRPRLTVPIMPFACLHVNDDCNLCMPDDFGISLLSAMGKWSLAACCAPFPSVCFMRRCSEV